MTPPGVKKFSEVPGSGTGTSNEAGKEERR